MFAIILSSQFSPCPGITIITDDVITTTDDVITATDDAIRIICIDLEGKLMCCKKVGITHGNIDATIITQQPKNMLLVKVSLYQKIISSKRGS